MMISPKGLLYKLSLVIFVAALLLSACAGAAAPTPEVSGAGRPAESAPPVAYDTANSASGASSAQAIKRIVIKNASISIVVANPQISMETIGKMAEEMGGFIVSANLYQMQTEMGTEVPRANITIRVPVERLDEAMSRIRSQSDQPPQSENLTSQDVTQEYTDLSSRLRNAEAAEAQLAKFLEQTEKTEDTLAVYQQLTHKREEIEVLKGQINYYEQSAALSAISVDLIANEAVQPLTLGRWQPEGTVKDAVQALLAALRFLGNAAIWTVILILPVGLAIVLPIWLVIRGLRWLFRRGKKGAPRAVANTPPPASG